MPNMTGAKIKRIGLPLLWLGFALTGSLSLFHWLLVLHAGLITLDLEILEIWLPGGIAAILVGIVILPRLRLLSLSGKRNTSNLFFMLAVAVLAIPAGVAQCYMHNATGELVHVTDLAAIPADTTARYFAPPTICLAKGGAVGQPVTETDSHNTTLTINLHVYVPACVKDYTQMVARVWVDLQYSDSMSTQLTSTEKDARYRTFLNSAQEKLNADAMTEYSYLERVLGGTEYRTFEKALQNNKVASAKSLLLKPWSGAFESRAGDTLNWLLGSFVIGNLLWLAFVAATPVNESAWASTENVHERNGLAALITPTMKNYGLPLLLDTNVLVYLAMVLSGLGIVSFQADDLIAWGGNYGPAIHGLGVLRLFSSQFIHAGLMHVANNMYGLLFAGIILAPVATNLRLIVWYLACGLGGSAASIVVHPDIVGVGASGAIFGLFGIALTLSLLKDARFGNSMKAIWINAGIFVAINLGLGDHAWHRQCRACRRAVNWNNDRPWCLFL